MYPYLSNSEPENQITMKAGESRSPAPINSAPDKKLLELLETAVGEAGKSADYFKNLSTSSEDVKAATLLRSIHLDILKACKLLREIYYIASGNSLSANNDSGAKAGGNTQAAGITDGVLEEAMFSCLNSSELYKELYSCFMNVEIRDMLFDIITDALRHSVILAMLCAGIK